MKELASYSSPVTNKIRDIQVDSEWNRYCIYARLERIKEILKERGRSERNRSPVKWVGDFRLDLLLR